MQTASRGLRTAPTQGGHFGAGEKRAGRRERAHEEGWTLGARLQSVTEPCRSVPLGCAR